MTRRAFPGPPPWLWLVLGLYLSQIPAQITWWTSQFKDLLGHGAYAPEVAASGGFRTLTALSVAQLMPVVFLLAGMSGVLLPHLRRRIVERRYGLRTPDDPELEVPPETGVLLGQIRRFLAEQAPGVELRVNPVRQDQIARVYPGGWRTTRIAAFLPLVVLWRRDRDTAETVLLHELGHHRQGEQHVTGLGSPFVALIGRWPYVFALFGLVPTALLLASGNPTGHLIIAQVLLVILRVPHALLIPVSALWTAELAADRYAAAVHGRRSLLTALAAIETTAPGRLAGLHHPPVRMRRWFAGNADRRAAHLLLVLLLPAALLADVLLALAGAVVEYRLLGAPWGNGLWKALALARHELAGGPQWWAVLATLAVWPLLADAWPRLWGWRGHPVGTFSVGAYAAAALLPVIALALGLAPESARLAQARTADPWDRGAPQSATPMTPPPTARAPASATPCPLPSAPTPPARPIGLPTVPARGADAVAGTGAPPSPPSGGRRSFRTSRVVSAERLIGSDSGMRDTRDRLAHTHWTWENDGTLTVGSAGPRLRTTAIEADARVLRGASTVTTAVSATSTWVDARLRLPAGRPAELTLIWAATSVTHAVVNCESFDSTVTAAARFVLILDAS